MCVPCVQNESVPSHYLSPSWEILISLVYKVSLGKFRYKPLYWHYWALWAFFNHFQNHSAWLYVNKWCYYHWSNIYSKPIHNNYCITWWDTKLWRDSKADAVFVWTYPGPNEDVANEGWGATLCLCQRSSHASIEYWKVLGRAFSPVEKE